VVAFNPVKLFACLVAVASGIAIPAFAGGGLYTTYTLNGSNTIDLSTCGSTGTEQGCFGGTSLIRLNGVCSLLAGPVTTQGDATRQPLYVLETGSDALPVVTLKIYSKVVKARPVMIGPNPSTDVSTTATLVKSVNLLKLKGGTNVTCQMAANATSLFVGTSATTHALQVDKVKFTSRAFGGGRLHDITADEHGYVRANFEGRNPNGYTFGPDGKELSLGGLANPVVIPNQTNGIPLH
jgi:hypothetical protein